MSGRSPLQEFVATRKLPDGRYEFKSDRGRGFRAYVFRCVECNRTLPDFEFSEEKEICNRCNGKIITEAKKRALLESAKNNADWYKERVRQLAREAKARRCAALKAATPKWVDREEIREIYIHATMKSIQTGIDYHVDHIWPLQHKLFCGLHVPWNLRAIPKSENLRKKNHPPELILALA